MDAKDDSWKDSLTFKTEEFLEGIRADVKRMIKEKEAEGKVKGFHTVNIPYGVHGKDANEFMDRWIEENEIPRNDMVVGIHSFIDPDASEPEKPKPHLPPWKDFEPDPVNEDLLPDPNPLPFTIGEEEPKEQPREDHMVDIVCGLIDEDPEIERKYGNKVRFIDRYRNRSKGPWGWMV